MWCATVCLLTACSATGQIGVWAISFFYRSETGLLPIEGLHRRHLLTHPHNSSSETWKQQSRVPRLLFYRIKSSHFSWTCVQGSLKIPPPFERALTLSGKYKTHSFQNPHGVLAHAHIPLTMVADAYICFPPCYLRGFRLFHFYILVIPNYG